MLEQQSAAREQLLPQRLVPKDYEEHMTWRIRWYLIIAITIAYTLSLIGGLIGFGVTKDPHYLLFIASTVLVPFVYYLVPMDKKKFDLKMAKINTNNELFQVSVRIQILEAELCRWQDSTGAMPKSKQQVQLPVK
jgi:hypothetical protein